MPETTIYLVDDDVTVLSALGRLLSAAGHNVQAHSNAAEFLKNHDPDAPGCAVLDLEMPGVDGLGVQNSLASSSSDRQVIFLTGHGTIPATVQAMKAGAVDFLMKPVQASTILAAVATALERDLEARRVSSQRQAVKHRMASLSPREREVLAGVLDGRLNKQIAGDLGIGEKTVKVHRKHLMSKLGARTVAELARLVTQYRT